MGKRELLIIVAFVVVGAVAYQLAAPPSKPGERGFSVSKIFSGIRKEISANASSAHITKTGTIAVPANVSELRVSVARSVPLTIVGETRDDIAFELPVESTGPDEATATEWANKVVLRTDDLGAAMALSTFFPEEGTQNATLTLKVPAGLSVRVENSGRVQVSNVAAVELRNLAGETALSAISAAVTGSHRSGDLTITGAGTVTLALSSSRAKIRNVTNGVTLTARSGECWIGESSGAILVNGTNAEFVINAAASAVTVNGDGGQVKVIDAHQLSVDARRMQVEIETSVAAGDSIMVLTTEEPVRLALGAPHMFSLDAVTTGGAIRASDFGLEPVTEAREVRLNTVVGKPVARLVLRNSRGDIVINKRK